MIRVLELLDKEADGEITRLELDELERLILTDPEARRRRDFNRSLAAELSKEPAGPELDLVRLARALVEAPPAPAARRRGAAVALALAAALLGVLVARPVSRLLERPAQPRAVVLAEDGWTDPPPVRVRVAGDHRPSPEAPPISIRF